jgi:DNA-binding NtrC family response regulator
MMTEEAFQALEAYDWPGNVRQLKSCLDRARLCARNSLIGAADLRF